MQRTATAHWEGNFKEGKGNLTSQSTILNKTPYSFKTRFEEGAGTNPEELIAAAHAGCFTMSVDLL
jgi:osmotically inducible protein OsmC